MGSVLQARNRCTCRTCTSVNERFLCCSNCSTQPWVTTIPAALLPLAPPAAPLCPLVPPANRAGPGCNLNHMLNLARRQARMIRGNAGAKTLTCSSPAKMPARCPIKLACGLRADAKTSSAQARYYRTQEDETTSS
eukprot:GHRR01022990.1.p1 GENE.GHRR01022990.1~~GHRR01022990.1.p1  ORF type:complete len:136 (+),score=15.68 GHRR01022990.1:890-1297(+)